MKRATCGNQRPSDLVKGFVWTLKYRSKVVSGTDVHCRAMVRKADELQRQGRGGGIVSLLLPQDPEAQARLELDRRFELALVRDRKGGERARARDLESVTAFLLAALLLKGESLNSSWKVKHFCDWIVDSLKDKNSNLYRLAKDHFPLFLEQGRRLRWWQNRVTALRKMSR
jgi:hypothetical protein